MNDVDFYNLIRKKLILLHNVSEENAPYVVETIRLGRKKVNNMDYAIVYNHDKQVIDYFVRKNDIWERDNINNQPVTDELACILRETCNYKKNECITTEQDAKEIMASSIQKISNEFDKKYEKTIEDNRIFTEKMLKYYTLCIPKIKEIDKYRLLQYTLKEYSEGLTLEDIELKQSPNAALRDKILGQSDIVKKYEDILKFIEKYTLTMNGEDFKTVDVYDELTGEEFENFTREKSMQDHWLYCKETKIRLLPKFYFYLAKTFKDTPSEYARRLDLLCFSIGKKSDDGDKYVDKYSGYTIRVIDFAQEFGETEDIDIDPIFVEMEEKNMSLLERRILNIVKTMESNMRIDLHHDHAFILTTTVQAYNSITISEREFNEFIAQREKKKEKSYNDYSNANLLYLTLGVFFIAIQTNIPEIKFKYSFPGCRKSFSGYPLSKDDENGLEYIACVASKIKSTIPPWNVLKGKKDVADINKIKKELKKMIEENLLPDLGVKDRILLRIQNKDNHILDMGLVVDNTHSVSKWLHFMPAIIPFHVKEIMPISESFKTNLSTMIKNGNRKQIDSIEAIEAKIIFYSYYFQNIIQGIVSKKALLSVNLNQPFIDNCCNDKNGISCLQYFEEENSNITTINNIIESLSAILGDIVKLTQSRTLYTNINTKNATYIQNTRTYNEDVVIRALMIINKYVTFIDLQNEEVYRNKVTEKIEEGVSFSTEEFVKDLKKIGSEQRVFYREKQPLSPLSIFQEIKEDLESEPVEDVNNFLSIKNDEYNKIICDFIYENHQFKKEKNREIREIRDILSLGNWKKVDTIEGFYKNINFLKNMIYLFSRVFPWIILNKQNHKITIPYYWGLSKTDDLKIKACIEKYYSELETFFGDPQTTFYKSLGETVLKTEKYFILSEVTKGNTGEGLFGEYTSLLLQKYYLLSVFHHYIVSANNSKTTEVLEDGIGNELLISGKSRALKKQISGLLYLFIQYIKNNKVSQNIQYEEIMERVFLLKEKEKETFTERLERKDEYEREVDNVMKQFGLGDWGKGNKKTLFQYSKYGEDDVLKEKLAIVEAKMMENSNVTENNIDQYVNDELQEMVDTEFMEGENNDLSEILDDYANNFEED